MTTQDEFLRDLQPANNDVFEQPLEPQPDPIMQDQAEEPEVEEASNRRERRLKAKLQAERESAIALAARLEALTEAQKFRNSEDEADYLKAVERIYGTQTPESIEATELLKATLKNVERAATERAIEALRAEQFQEENAVIEEEQNLDSMIDDLEEEYGISMDEDTQKGFFTLLEKLSPKDRNGNVIEYADHHAVWEEYQVRRERMAGNSNRARDLASRSVVRSGASPSTSVEVDSNERWLRENGII